MLVVLMARQWVDVLAESARDTDLVVVLLKMLEIRIFAIAALVISHWQGGKGNVVFAFIRSHCCLCNHLDVMLVQNGMKDV